MEIPSFLVSEDQAKRLSKAGCHIKCYFKIEWEMLVYDPDTSIADFGLPAKSDVLDWFAEKDLYGYVSIDKSSYIYEILDDDCKLLCKDSGFFHYYDCLDILIDELIRVYLNKVLTV